MSMMTSDWLGAAARSLVILRYRASGVSKRHPEVRASWRASKDVWQGAGPVSFEARIRSRLRMTGITGQVGVILRCRASGVSKRHPEVRASWRASKDVWQRAGPGSFEARFRSRLRMTGITGQVGVILKCRASGVSKRHPEVRASWRASKDVWQGAGPVSFEARKSAHLRMTGALIQPRLITI